MNPLLLGIDLGSTNLKAVVYDLAGHAVAQASRPTELFHPDPGHPDWAVWRPEQIWGGVCEALREAIGGLSEPRAIRGVAVTGMGMDGLPIDDQGQWLYPLISWHCPRTRPQYDRWLEQVGATRQFQIGGNQIWVFNTALRLQWMAEHEPEILRRTYKWLLIEDFVNYMLCGRAATDYSMASTTLLFDQRRRAWSDELLASAGIDRRLLCDPLPSGTVLGEVHAPAAQATGLPLGTPVVLGGHDYCCGALPTGAFRTGVVLDVIGTWEMIVAALDAPVLEPAVLGMGVLVDSHVAPGMWSAMGATVAADMLEWFRRELGADERRQAAAEGRSDWDLLMQAAVAAPVGSHGVMFLPHMSGSHCPVVDPRSAGAWVGLRNMATKGDLLRAVVEGLSFQFLQVLRGFESSLGVQADRVVAVGGPTNNTFWMQTKADVSGRTIESPQLDEAVPLGAAILAGLGTGLYRDLDEAFARVWRPGRRYEPDPLSHARYAAQLKVYEQLHPALAPIHARLRA